MQDNDTSRLSRLTSIITQMQTKRIITAPALAAKFGVSIRTIYRDMRSLEAAGIPLITEEGKGYSLMEGYRLPPVMFTEKEANALITAEQIVSINNDISFVSDLKEAINKIRSVLRYDSKDKVDLLSSRVHIWNSKGQNASSNYLSTIQLALTNFKLIRIEYHSPINENKTTRDIEPFAMISNAQVSWYLIAFCRLRNDFRTFKLDRINKMEILNITFTPHKMSMEEYYNSRIKNNFTPLT